MNGKCIFCEFSTVPPPSSRVLSNPWAGVFLDNYPVTPLHLLIIPYRHVPDYFGLNWEESRAMDEMLIRARGWIEEQDKAVTGYNIGMNVGEDAGQTVMHCHVHLIPRRKGDVANPRGGIRNLIPGKGDYLQGSGG